MNPTPPQDRLPFVLVPHTHWDREWYEPFEVFRARLVTVVDEVVDLLESEPDFRFTLDGQSAAIVDYLEIRPENTDRVRRQVERGALALGPWYILMDEFSCSGETIVRNLERGRAVAASLGGTMKVGHLPDMFGHIAQMPQILAGFGIADAVLWRGVPASVESHAFTWQAPDGSRVRTENLFDGYANALDLFAHRAAFHDEVEEYARRTASWWAADPMLGLVGSDHTSPVPGLMDLVRSHRDTGTVALEIGTLADYLRIVREHTRRTGGSAASVPVIDGELRSHARGNLLPGVFSIRTMLKDAMARAEDAVIEAEALDALHRTGSPHPLLDLAWRRIIESSAHDSVTGCGTDETARQVTARLESAGHLARAVRADALACAVAATPADAVLAVNALPWEQSVILESDVPLPGPTGVGVVLPDGTCQPTQHLLDLPHVLGDEHIESRDLERILHRIHGRELFGSLIERYEWSDQELTFWVSRAPATQFNLPQLRSEIEQARTEPGPWRVRTLAQPTARVLAQIPVPAGGHTAVRFVATENPVPALPAEAYVQVHAAGTHVCIKGQGISVDINPQGTCDLIGADGTRLEGVGELIDDGDRGDAYNYGPTRGPGISRPDNVQIDVIEHGPLRARVAIERSYSLPVGLDPNNPARRHTETTTQRVRTTVEVRRGEPFARLSVRVVNAARDHRLRILVPTAKRTGHTEAAGQFARTRRGTRGEGGWGEFPLTTYPAYESISAAGAHILVDKLTEFELVDRAALAAGMPPDDPDAPPTGDGIAVTVLRAVGAMSVNVHPLRDEPAGAQIPVPGAQYEGVCVQARWAVLPSLDPQASHQIARWATVFRHPGSAMAGSGTYGDPLPSAVAGVRIAGRAVPTSLRALPSGVRELRLMSTADEPTTVEVVGLGDRLVRTDLAGHPECEVPAHAVPVLPNRVVTLHAR